MNNGKEIFFNIRQHIKENFKTINKVTPLADLFGITPKLMQDLFKHYSGLSPKDFLKETRLKRLDKLIVSTKGKEYPYYYAEAIGLNSSPSLSNFIKRSRNQTFKEYKEYILYSS